jgi:hypothetical protein
VEVSPATNIATTMPNEQEEKEGSTLDYKEKIKEEIKITTIVAETQTQENVVEAKSTTTIAGYFLIF